jgi:hypothetical protein
MVLVKNRKFEMFIGLILILLMVSVLVLLLHQYTTWFKVPRDIYLSAYYSRTVLSFACIFFGLFSINRKMKYGYSLLFIGILLSILSIAPPIISLYFIKDIEMSLLDHANVMTINDAIEFQMKFLKNIGIIFTVFIAAYIWAITKAPKQKTEP